MCCCSRTCARKSKQHQALGDCSLKSSLGLLFICLRNASKGIGLKTSQSSADRLPELCLSFNDNKYLEAFMQVPLLHPTLSILLLPVLIYQGQKVRQEVPKLPEPDGPRHGQQGPSNEQPLRVLILGDSAAAGVGVEHQRDALSGQLVGHLPDNVAVEWRLLAKNGLNLAQITEALSHCDEQFDVAVVSAGVNDATGRTRRYQFLCQLQELSYRLQRHHGVKQILYTAVPPMQVFPSLPQPLRWYLGQRAKRLNSVLRAHCNKCDAAKMMVVDFPFAAEYMASDGFHPSAKGYRLWGGRSAALIKEWMNDSVPRT